MKAYNFEHIIKHKSRSSLDSKQRITYTFNNVENVITGSMEEEGNMICLYEYRGIYVGTEFLISFAKDSISYKLISVEEKEEVPVS